MALGTPVVAATAYSASGGTTVTPAYPTGIQSTDSVLLFVGQKPSTANGGTVTTPSGWTLQDDLLAAGGYGTTLGADTGNTNLRVYSWNTPVAGQTGNLTVTLGTNNITWAFMVRIPTGGGTVTFGSADGQRTTTPTSPMSIALTNGTPTTGFKAGDLAIWAMCIPTDVTTPSQFSAQSITATGATFATAVELNEPDSATGNDIGGYSAYASVTAGSSTTAPTVAVTLAGTLTNVRGPVVLLRVRELPFIDAQDAAFTITGQNATLADNRVLNAEVGSFTYTGEDATLTKTSPPKELNAEAGDFTIVGQAATLADNRALNAETGSFAYTGQDASLLAAKNINAQAGAVTYTGQAATLAAARQVNAEAGSFSYTGEPATLTYAATAKILNAEPGAFTYTGQAASLTQAQALNAEAGTFAYTGQAATLLRGYAFSADAGAFLITGQAATLAQSYSFEASAGSFAYLGQDAEFLRNRSFSADAAAFGEADPYVDPGYMNPGYVTGLTATLGYSRAFEASPGSFFVAGQPATLAVVSLYPPESDVRFGVVYGPDGVFTGTYVAGGGRPIFVFDD